MSDSELESMISDLESDRIERKDNLSGERVDRQIREAICAFSNDLPGRGQPGLLFIGVDDKGRPVGLKVTDDLLLRIAGIRSEGRIQPLPNLTVERRSLKGGEVIVVTVQPASAPPVRFDGRVWIRVGPRQAVASPDEERRLTEKRQAADLPFDEQPIRGATASDLNTAYFRDVYLPKAVAGDVLKDNRRSIEQQLASLRFLSADLATPTAAGILVLGNDPLMWIPGAYVQFVRFEGADAASAIRNQKRFDQRLEHVLQDIDHFLPLAIETARLSKPGSMQHEDVADYPVEALRELVFNAIMHRNYATSHAPVRIFWFAGRVEIDNPGGLFGRVTPENFDRTSDCRNPVLAEAMKTFRYVERYGIGITRVKAALARNGNPPPEFSFEPGTTRVVVRKRGKE